MNDYIVSARKYRPATFASVVGQSHITSTLKNAISRGQLAHAYLFCGPRGVGKTTCARIFAKAINCLSPVDNEACNECESCRSFNDGRSFSIHELDAASNNSVDDIRSLTDQVRIPPQVGRYSVYIIDEVHMLSSAAFNAFLKTLEEPPAHAIFILATTEKHKILPTILSRCQIFDFNRIRIEDVVGYLKYIGSQEGITADEEALNLIAAKADGGMRDALSMFDKAVSFCGTELHYAEVAKTLNVLDYDTYFGIVDLLLAGDYPGALVAFDGVLSRGFSPQTFIAGLGAHMRDLLMCKDQRTAPLLEVTGTLLDKYKAQGSRCQTGFLFEAIALLTSLDGTLRTASNQRLNVELGLMKLCSPGQKKNSPVTADNGSSLSLPDISGGRTASTTSAAPTARSSARPETAARTPDAPVTSRPAAAQPSAPEATATPAPEPQSPPKPVQRQTRAAMNAIPHTISGTPITSILNGGTSDDDYDQESDPASYQEQRIDPRSQEKITDARERFVKKLHSERPRIAMAFRDMTVDGNTISVRVSNDQLYEEIVRNRTEILTMLGEVAAVDGTIEMTVNVTKDDPSARKPIRAEDKLRYMTEKNPALTAFRKALDLDIE